MRIGAELMDSIFCKHTIQKILKIQWRGFEPRNSRSGYASGRLRVDKPFTA